MSRRTTANVFLALSALLYTTRYLAAAIFGSGMLGWSKENFQALLTYIGSDLVILSVVALVFGICYLLWAEFEHAGFRKK